MVVGIAYLPASIIRDQMLPDQMVAVNNARIEQDLTATEMVAVGIGLPPLIAAIINLVGLYRFRSNARPWAVGISIAMLPLCILFGPWIDSGVGELLSSTSMVLWGVVLAMMYCRPYAELFASDAIDS